MNNMKNPENMGKEELVRMVAAEVLRYLGN